MAQSITLQTSDDDIIAGDILGRLSFAASSESSGSDALLISAGIYAEADTDFTATNNSTSLVFSTASSESATGKLKITGSGHLLPTINSSFDLGSSAYKFRNLYVDNLIGFSSSLSGNLSGDLNLNSYNIVGTGNVGIGTTFPSVRLQVEGGNIVFNDAGDNFDFRVEGDADANLLFLDASNDTVNIGIGTSTGSKLLVSTDNSRSYQHILASGGIATESSFIRIANQSNITADSFAGFAMSANRSGSNVGQAAIIACVATNATLYQPHIVFSARNGSATYAELMRINHLGDVGIGTSSPTYKLDVVGTGNFSQNLLVNGTAVSVSGHTHVMSDILTRSVSASSTSGTLTPNSSTTDLYVAEGLTGAITFAVPSGTPSNGQKLLIRLKDNGVGRGITWTTSTGGYRAIGVTLPTTTVASKTTYVGCIYNSADTFWDVVATVTQS